MSQAKKESLGRVLKKLPRKLWGLVSRNWLLKLFSLVLAICLWAGLISQDATLTREKVFSDAVISISGADSLRRGSGLVVVSGLEEDNLKARLRVDVPQKEYNTVTASNFNPRVDLNRITAPGEQTLKVITTSTAAYGTVRSVSPETVTVTVDEYVTNYRIPITVSCTGEAPEGLYASTPVCTLSNVAVSGPKTLVDRITGIAVDFDLSTLPARTGDIRLSLPFRYLSNDGSEIPANWLEATSVDVVLRTLTVSVSLYHQKQLPVNLHSLVSGTPAKGYAVTGVTVSPETLTVYGAENVLSEVHELFAESAVDVSGLSQSITHTIRLQKPADNVNLLSSTATVQVEIQPVIITRSFNGVKLLGKGLKDSLSASLPVKTVSLDLTGSQVFLQSLKAGDITAYVDESAIDEPGVYELSVDFYTRDSLPEQMISLVTPSFVTVTVTAP